MEKQVRYFSHDTGLDKAILFGIVDFNKKAFCFRKRGELHHNAPYIIEGADILIGDWDWTDVFKLSDADKLLRLRQSVKEFYD